MITIHGLEPKRYNITAEGLRELEGQLRNLKQQRAEIAAELHELSSQSGNTGTLEDSAFAVNRARATETDNKIMLLERITALAHIIQKPVSNDKVQIGSRLSVLMNNTEYAYTIVGSIEANPLQGKISNESPLGRSLLGKKVNEQFEVVVPSRPAKVATIIKIEG